MASSKTKIYFFIDSFRIGGMHRQILYLVKYLDRSLFEPIVCTQSQFGGLAKEFEKSGCQLVDLKWKGRGSLAILFRLIKALNKDKPDIIFITQIPNLIYFLLARLFLNKRIIQIGSFRAMDCWLGHINKNYRIIDIFFARLLYKTSQKVVVNCEALKNHYSKFINVNSKKNIEVIYNGSDFQFPITIEPEQLKYELKINKNDLIVVMIARLDPAKDFSTFLDAAKDIITTNKSVKFLIVGDGVLRRYIFETIIRYNIKDNFILLGEKKNVFDYLNLADISVLSSHGEGFSNTVLESMSFGKAVIASNVGGNSELIQDTRFGILVTNQSVKELFEAIKFLSLNKNVRLKMGEAAKSRIYELSNLNQYILNYQQFFLSI
jgi:glycosyltransferase involved in cell wall biosynthesis